MSDDEIKLHKLRSDLDDKASGIDAKERRGHVSWESHLPRSLCARCQRAMIVRSHRSNDYHIFCNELSGFDSSQIEVPHDIAECSRYAQIGQLSLYEMAGMATILEPDKKRAGFKIIKKSNEY